jgi:uncharacterized protein (TIGR02284 family)
MSNGKSMKHGVYMPTVISSIVDVISKLIETCHDGADGFKTAASAVTDPALKSELLLYSGQRAEFVEDLEEVIIDLGETPPSHGSFGAAIQRGWMHLVKAVGSNEHAILATCERGEDTALKAYREAASSALPSGIGALVASEYQSIKRVHDRIKTLRDGSKQA